MTVPENPEGTVATIRLEGRKTMCDMTRRQAEAMMAWWLQHPSNPPKIILDFDAFDVHLSEDDIRKLNVQLGETGYRIVKDVR